MNLLCQQGPTYPGHKIIQFASEPGQAGGEGRWAIIKGFTTMPGNKIN